MMNKEETVEQPVSEDERNWGLFAHLSPLALGFIGPLIIWLVKKDESNYVAEHGKEALNFQITILIGMMLSIPLLFVLVGGLLMAILAILNLVFIILATIEASKGCAYRYPVSIRLVK